MNPCVRFIGSVCAVAASDCTDNSLRALSKLLMCKSCAGDASVQSGCTGTHTVAHECQRQDISNPHEGTSARLICGRLLSSVVALFHTCVKVVA